MQAQFSWIPEQEFVADTQLAEFLRQCGLPDKNALLARADEQTHWYWDTLLKFFDIRFRKPYDTVLDLSDGVEFPQWCIGGKLNMIDSCLAAHLHSPTADRLAVIWEGEDGSERCLTYSELADETAAIASLLASRGIGKGAVVAIYLPMLPECAAAFLAIAAIGAIAMPLFSGFGEVPLRERLVASGAVAIITADGARRRGKTVALKPVADRAASGVDAIHTIVVVRNCCNEIAMQDGRDVWWSESNQCGFSRLETEAFDAETPAMLMFTSGTSGKPKGTVHTQCGLLGKNALDMSLCIDLKEGDRLLWMSDMGWIVGPKVIVSCTLAGATMVFAEGAPDWPNRDRLWRLIERHGVTIYGQAPTLARQYMQYDDEIRQRHDLGSLRMTISSGEPWTETAWHWFFEHVCGGGIPILNYAGGTECGGAILAGTLHDPMKPGSFGGPVPGMGADIVDDDGKPLKPDEPGELVLCRPSIGLSRGLWNDRDGFLRTYWSTFPGTWVQRDLAMRDEDGLWYLLGRSDDTIKIAGKRTGPAEIESLILSAELVSEVGVVGIPDPITGTVLACVCVARPGGNTTPDADEIASLVADSYGKPYRPAVVLFVRSLPKTRNQKIVRRAIRAALTGEPLGDVSTIETPQVLEEIRMAMNEHTGHEMS